MRHVHSFAKGAWVAPDADARPIASAITGTLIAGAGNNALDVQGMLSFARDVGGPALRAMTFHDRARMLKALALHLMAHKETLYEDSYDTGATLSDHKIDVDGGIGTMLVFASKGRREMPDGHVFLGGRGAHQRLQLSRLGHAGKAGPDPAGRCARHRETGHRDLLCHGNLRAVDDRQRHPA